MMAGRDCIDEAAFAFWRQISPATRGALRHIARTKRGKSDEGCEEIDLRGPVCQLSEVEGSRLKQFLASRLEGDVLERAEHLAEDFAGAGKISEAEFLRSLGLLL